MPPTKPASTVLADNISLAAGGAGHTTVIHNLTGYGGTLYIKHTNGATPPTVAAASQVKKLTDDTHAYNVHGPLSGQLGANGEYSWAIPLDMDTRKVQVVTTAPVTQPVTLRIEITEVTAIQ